MRKFFGVSLILCFLAVPLMRGEIVDLRSDISFSMTDAYDVKISLPDLVLDTTLMERNENFTSEKWDATPAIFGIGVVSMIIYYLYMTQNQGF